MQKELEPLVSDRVEKTSSCCNRLAKSTELLKIFKYCFLRFEFKPAYGVKELIYIDKQHLSRCNNDFFERLVVEGRIEGIRVSATRTFTDAMDGSGEENGGCTLERVLQSDNTISC